MVHLAAPAESLGISLIHLTSDYVFDGTSGIPSGGEAPNFVQTMIKLMNKLDTIKVVDDQIGSPTWTRDLVELICTIITADIKNYGTYHFSGEGQCSWYDFAGEIFKLWKNESFNCL